MVGLSIGIGRSMAVRCRKSIPEEPRHMRSFIAALVTLLAILVKPMFVAAQSLPSTSYNNVTVTGAVTAPQVGTSTNAPLSMRANGTEFLRGFDAGSGRMRVQGKFTTDSNSTAWFNNGQFIIGSEGYNNAIVGYVANNLPASTLAFPTAVTGICYNKGAGNTCFGMYGEAHATTTGVTPAAELAAFQDSAPAPVTFPFANTIGTRETLAKSLQLTAGTATAITLTGNTHTTTTIDGLSKVSGLMVGQVVSGSGVVDGSTIASIGVSSIVLSLATTSTLTGVSLRAINPAAVALEIGREGSTSGRFQYGMALAGDAPLLWSYYQDGSLGLGPRNGIYMAYNGQGFGMVLQPTVNVNGNNAVMTINDAAGNSKANIRQNGQAFFGNSASTGSVLTLTNTAGACTLTPTAGAASFVCSSDEKLKRNIINAQPVMSKISSFLVREYDLKSTGDHLTGVIAQEVQVSHPEMVHADDKGMLSVDAPNPWMLVKGMQELKADNDNLRLELRIAEAIGTIGLIGLSVYARRRKAS